MLKIAFGQCVGMLRTCKSAESELFVLIIPRAEDMINVRYMSNSLSDQ